MTGRPRRRTPHQLRGLDARELQTKSIDVHVRAPDASDYTAWREMWNAYCRFYETAVPERVSQSTWRRISAGDGSIAGLIAVAASTGVPLGFANYVVHPYTWSERSACYLEDLFVRADARGGGVGGALIEHLIALGDVNGWARLYWMTRANNDTARRLYDKYCHADDFVRYVRERD
jgi:GNAT superfamily N-acetyltransferase